MAPITQLNKTKTTNNNKTPRKTSLLINVKYCNTLPDLPLDVKSITFPFDPTRYTTYNHTTLERDHQWEFLTNPNLGLDFDLVNTVTDKTGAKLDPDDEDLLEEEIDNPKDLIRSQYHARPISWLRRSQYISTEQTRFQPKTIDRVEVRVGYNIKRQHKIELFYMNRESQVKAIQKTFEDAKIPIEHHYSKPNVVPVEVMSIYPDFKNWKHPCAQVIFDTDPATVGKKKSTQIEEMSQAVIRGIVDDNKDTFVGYFLPTEETLVKCRKDSVDYKDDQVYEYKMAQEHDWNVKKKGSKGYGENYYFVVRENGVYYNELETRIRLRKRRDKFGKTPRNTRLIMQHRPMNEQECDLHRLREKQLEPPGVGIETEVTREEERSSPKGPKYDNNENFTDFHKIGSKTGSKSWTPSPSSSTASELRSHSVSRSSLRSRSPPESGIGSERNSDSEQF